MILKCRGVRGSVGMLLYILVSDGAGPVNGDSKITSISRDVR